MQNVNQTEFKQTASNAGLIGITALGGALVGFVLQLLVAFYFGAGRDTDAFFMAQSTSELLSKLLLGGSITTVFIPMFVERLTRGRKDDAWTLALNIFHVTAFVYLTLIVTLAVFASPFIRLIAPGFDESSTALTVGLLRILLPSFFFLFLVDLATAMLHSLKRFALPALLRIVAPAISIIMIVLFINMIGIYALALGAVVGSTIQFVILSAGLKRQGLSYTFVLKPRDPAIKKMLYLVYPFIFSVLVTSGAGIVYRILVSDLAEGSLASLKFAEKITQLLTIMFLNSVTLVIFPLLAEKAGNKDMSGMRNTIGSAIRLIFFVTVPLVIGVAMLREPLIALVYQHGQFSLQDAQMTSIALLFLVIGLTTNGISSVFGHAVLALQQTRAAVAVTIASQAIAISLFVLLVPTMKHAGLALGSSLVPLSIALLYFLYLTRFIPKLISVFQHATYVKTIVLAAILMIVVQITLKFTQDVTATGKAAAFIQVILPTIAGSLAFFGAAYMWKIQEMNELVLIVKSKRAKWTQKHG